MSTKHTPGPWGLDRWESKRNGNNNIWVFGGSDKDSVDDVNICEMILESESETIEANARLIAAAPEMFEALIMIIENWRNLDSEEYKVAVAAIAKVEGSDDVK